MKRRESSSGKSNDKKAAAKASTPPVSSPSSPSHNPGRKSTGRRDFSGSTEMFEARRSTRVAANKYCHDGDVWQETLAVCETPVTKNGQVKMMIRSYYSNQRTGDRVWDEPPSGATTILPATEHMRQMAQAQLQEMQITFGTFPEQPPEKKRGFLRKVLSTPSSTSTASNTVSSPKYKVQYKPGSILSKVKKQPPRKMDDTLDPQVQQAIALSMNESINSHEEPVIRSEVSFVDNDIEMVMALSLSEAESKNRQMSEEEELQRAIVESRRTSFSPHVAALPIKDEFSGLGLSQSSSSEQTRRKQRSNKDAATTASDDSLMDQKMPAKPTKSSLSSRTKSDGTEETVSNDKNGRTKAINKTSRDAKHRSSHGSSSEGISGSATCHADISTSDRKLKAPTKDSKPSSSRGMSKASSRSSLTEDAKRDTKSRSSHSSSSGSSRSSLSNDKSDRLNRRVNAEKPTKESPDTKLPTKPTPTAASKYGKSVRPPSNKNLTITRSSSGGSRKSMNTAKEIAAIKRAAGNSLSASKEFSPYGDPKVFSPYGDPIETSPKGLAIEQYQNTRVQKSLFAEKSNEPSKNGSVASESIPSGGFRRSTKQVKNPSGNL